MALCIEQGVQVGLNLSDIRQAIAEVLAEQRESPPRRRDRRPGLGTQDRERRQIRMTWTQIAAWRMQRHYLVKRAKPAKLLDVVAALGGLQAQVLSASELMLHARIDGLTREMFANALWRDRTLIKTWPCAARSTCCQPTNILCGNPRSASMATIYYPAGSQNFGITLEQLHVLTDAIGEALAARTAHARRIGRLGRCHYRRRTTRGETPPKLGHTVETCLLQRPPDLCARHGHTGALHPPTNR